MAETKRHKVVTVQRGYDERGRDTYAARCEDCDAITFGGFARRSDARAALAGHEDAPGAGGNQPEGETKKPAEDSVTSKATRHARAAAAKPGTVAADPRIVIKDTVRHNAKIFSRRALTKPGARRVAVQELDGLPVVVRRTTRGSRATVWRTGDGRWWRTGGIIQARPWEAARGGWAFVITLYKAANIDDLRFLLSAVAQARRGEGLDTLWTPITAPWARPGALSYANSRPYVAPYTDRDCAQSVRVCDDPLCSEQWHPDGWAHTVDSVERAIADGSYSIAVERDRGAKTWRIVVNAGDFYGTSAEVDTFVNDLQWMRAECDRANQSKEAA